MAAAAMIRIGNGDGHSRSSLTHALDHVPFRPNPDADHMRAILLRAVDAAKSAGATYADARAVRVIDQIVTSPEIFGQEWRAPVVAKNLGTVEETERHGISVRALVNGSWGFTASPWWTDDEAVTLARDAVAQARDNAQWSTSRVELAPAPVVTGTWTTPYRIDPFSVSIEEKLAVMRHARMAYHQQYPSAVLDHTADGGFERVMCQHTTRGLATSEGSYIVQHFYKTDIGSRDSHAQLSSVKMRDGHVVFNPDNKDARFDDTPVPVGTGWEAVLDADLRELSRAGAETAYESLVNGATNKFPRTIDIGQYTIVMDGATLGKLIGVTIGRATDIDRIVGDEANDSGTSYLGSDPLTLAGNYSFGSPLLTIHTTRAASVGKITGLPAVQWDDEGLVPTPFTLVQEGVLWDFPTTRERAAMLAPYYARVGRPVTSNGCAVSGDRFGFDLTTVGPPTLVTTPGNADATLDAMVSSVGRGILLTEGMIQTDFQLRQITIVGKMVEIVNGRVGRDLTGGAVQIDAAQLWKNLSTLGGPSTAQVTSDVWEKGRPPQMLSSAIVGVAGLFHNLPIVRKGQ